MNPLFNADWLAGEANYQEAMDTEILPYLQARVQKLTVSGEGGKPLYTVKLEAEDPVGSILIVHGFTENAYKYAELVYSLLHNGLNVVIYDQRGHGRSWRSEGIQDLSTTHVDDFSQYVTDMEAVIAQALTGFPKPWYVFAHSMGGAVTSLYLEKHPDTFARAVLCAPMIAPDRGGVPMPAARLLCGGASLLGKAKARLIGSKPYSGSEDFDTSCATSRARFDWYDGVKAAHPEFSNNGPTFGWTLESLNVTDKILAPGEVEKITCPVLLFTAGQDHSVLPEAQARFVERLKDGTRKVVNDARHEIYRSTDEVFFPWWHEILSFIKQEA